jgi:hypothetical protein
VRIWSCKIGETYSVPHGADLPMRQAVAKAYRELTGEEPDFIFSGWGAELTESERAVVEDRLPDPQKVASGLVCRHGWVVTDRVVDCPPNCDGLRPADPITDEESSRG